MYKIQIIFAFLILINGIGISQSTNPGIDLNNKVSKFDAKFELLQNGMSLYEALETLELSRNDIYLIEHPDGMLVHTNLYWYVISEKDRLTKWEFTMDKTSTIISKKRVVQLQTDSTTGVNEVINEIPISVDFNIHKRAGNFVPTVKIVNHSEKTLFPKHPRLQQVLAFVIMNKRGNLVSPVGIAKVSPGRQSLVLKPGEIFEYEVSEQDIELANEARLFRAGNMLKEANVEKLYFPFLSGTALFGYPLQKGKTYRMITVYRPYEGQEGICSKEKLIKIE